jgi:hypothetical protein
MTVTTGRESYGSYPSWGCGIPSQNPEEAYLLVNDVDIDDNPPQADSSPAHQLHINTVHQNFEGCYTKKQVQQAAHACRLMGMVDSPSKRDFQAMVFLNMLKDCSVTNNDICNAHNIYGPDLPSIRGKTVRQKPERVITDYVEIQKIICQFMGASPWSRTSCLSTQFYLWSWHHVALT